MVYTAPRVHSVIVVPSPFGQTGTKLDRPVFGRQKTGIGGIFAPHSTERTRRRTVSGAENKNNAFAGSTGRSASGKTFPIWRILYSVFLPAGY